MGGIGEKDALRRQLCQKRREIRNRRAKDEAIQKALLRLPEYGDSRILLAYVSARDEVFTGDVIEGGLKAGKAVYVPYCPSENRPMEFYRILSREELRPGAYGILEPEPNPSRRYGGEEQTLCIVPGLAFTHEGFRLGYGKGYYDRFLAGQNIKTLGLCYEELMLPRLPVEAHDRPVDLVLTEQEIYKSRP